MNQEWLNSNEFQTLPPVKQALIRALVSSGADKSAQELLPALMKANTELNKRGMGFTQQEQTLLMQALMQSMTPEEQKKFSMLQEMMKMNH